jgi:hypothetical protein
MAVLHIIFAPTNKLEPTIPGELFAMGMRQATLPIPDDLEGQDIYAVARKLAELLLEQL